MDARRRRKKSYILVRSPYGKHWLIYGRLPGVCSREFATPGKSQADVRLGARNVRARDSEQRGGRCEENVYAGRRGWLRSAWRIVGRRMLWNRT